MATKQYIIPQTEITALQHSMGICNNVSLNTVLNTDPNYNGDSWIEAL